MPNAASDNRKANSSHPRSDLRGGLETSGLATLGFVSAALACNTGSRDSSGMGAAGKGWVAGSTVADLPSADLPKTGTRQDVFVGGFKSSSASALGNAASAEKGVKVGSIKGAVASEESATQSVRGFLASPACASTSHSNKFLPKAVSLLRKSPALLISKITLMLPAGKPFTNRANNCNSESCIRAESRKMRNRRGAWLLSFSNA